MGLVAATTAALCIWMVLWSLGAKALDAMMLSLLIIVLAAAVRMLATHLPGRS